MLSISIHILRCRSKSPNAKYPKKKNKMDGGIQKTIFEISTLINEPNEPVLKYPELVNEPNALLNLIAIYDKHVSHL